MRHAALESTVSMLDAFIIEEIKRREAERDRAERARPKLEIPRRERPDSNVEEGATEEKRPGNGVIVIDL